MELRVSPLANLMVRPGTRKNELLQSGRPLPHLPRLNQPVTSCLQSRAVLLNVPAIIRLLRPKQWVKNAFVCAGILFGGQLNNLPLLLAMALAAGAFCLMGSGVYVLNDYLDRESDRKHPVKRKRPLASGKVSEPQAFAAAAGCVILSLAVAWIADARVLTIVLIYFTVNVAYSLSLKHQPVVDVFCISSGFMLRIMAGTWGIHIPPSGWLILTGMFITLFLGFAKRRAEWTDVAQSRERRPVLHLYSRELLDTFLSIAATGTVLSYGLYTLDPQTIALHHTDKLIYTLPFVLFGLFRYLYLLHSQKKGENPSADVFTDFQLLMCGLAFAGFSVWLLNR
jgi:4-hydroxybenzoate polyprenyltransferase